MSCRVDWKTEIPIILDPSNCYVASSDSSDIEWSTIEINYFLDIYEAHVKCLDDNDTKKRLWPNISMAMHEMGYFVSVWGKFFFSFVRSANKKFDHSAYRDRRTIAAINGRVCVAAFNLATHTTTMRPHVSNSCWTKWWTIVIPMDWLRRKVLLHWCGANHCTAMTTLRLWFRGSG